MAEVKCPIVGCNFSWLEEHDVDILEHILDEHDDWKIAINLLKYYELWRKR